ncbi:conserved hypothetical protein [Roseibium sp. TrichSKD4]|uniref:hypothetical protein n=1 Tax=Roseibium sp. TrichSKD4 TaxID=744980 RepID=UPI0001E5731E|nr:hypothetical protein [Roseibium sp. TrichSKD4]EFO28550.1 conserved hypothetical protein [Roseibium sp. TrichSKD4]
MPILKMSKTLMNMRNADLDLACHEEYRGIIHRLNGCLSSTTERLTTVLFKVTELGKDHVARRR